MAITKYRIIDTQKGVLNITSSNLYKVDQEVEDPVIKLNSDQGAVFNSYLRDEANFGTIGFGATDLSYSFSPSTVLGATGLYSFSSGITVQSSGYGTFTHGEENVSSETFATTFGYQNSNSSYAGFVGGYSNLLTSAGYGTVFGNNNTSDTEGGIMAGIDLLSTAGVGTAIFGAANVDLGGTNNGTEPTQPMIIVGNGTHTTPVGAPWVASVRSNLLVGRRNGEFVLPSTTIAVIDAEASGRQVVTREWVLANAGGVAITDNQVAVGTGTSVEGDTGLTFDSATNILGVGVDDTEKGILSLYGASGTALDGGGEARFYATSDNDTTIDYYRMRLETNFSNFTIEPVGGPTVGADLILGNTTLLRNTTTGGQIALGKTGASNTFSSDGETIVEYFGNPASNSLRFFIGDPTSQGNGWQAEFNQSGQYLELNGGELYVGQIYADVVQTNGNTVATLPTAFGGERAHVTDSTVAAAGNFGATVVGGGSNTVPVFYDGTNWIIA